jgi:hypothetical protein
MLNVISRVLGSTSLMSAGERDDGGDESPLAIANEAVAMVGGECATLAETAACEVPESE